MRVLLVRPRRLNAMAVFGAMDCEPLELSCLAAACREAGAQAVCYDGVTEYRPFTQVLRTVRPRVLALTGYLTQEGEMEQYVRLAKAACPGCTVIVGGVHAQLNWTRLTWPGVDYVFRGESMADFARLLRALEAGEEPGEIPGLCRRGPEGFLAAKYVPCDVNALPIPERLGWQENRQWFRYLDFAPVSTLKTAVSCPFSCDFCYGRNLHGGRYQARRLDLVLEELAGLPGEYVFLVDSDFLLDEGRLNAFLDGVEERGIRKKYICYARADFIAAHPALTARLCRAGFTAFAVGLETAGDRRLEDWNKGTTLTQNEACIRVLRENGADCVALMIADPAFQKADFSRLYRWAREQGLRYVSVQILTPIPPTEHYRRMEDKLTTRDLSRWDFQHLVVEPEHMTRRQFMRRFHLLQIRLALLGRMRGAFRFVTPAYLWHCAVRYWRRKNTLR